MFFLVTGPLCYRWVPHTKASDAEVWCFLWSAPQQTVETIETLVIWYVIALIMTSLKCVLTLSHPMRVMFLQPTMSFSWHACSSIFKVFIASHLFHSLALKTSCGTIKLHHGVWTCFLWDRHCKCWRLHHEIISRKLSSFTWNNNLITIYIFPIYPGFSQLIPASNIELAI